MSREKRTLRPYTVDSAFQSALNGAMVWLDDQCCEAGSSLAVDDNDFVRHGVHLVWAVEGEFDRFRKQLTNAAWATGIHPKLLRLVVVARTGSLKLADKLLDRSLGEIEDLDRSVRLDMLPRGNRRPVFCAGTHGAVVDAYVALSPDWTAPVAAERRRPKRAASWLARATFRLDASSKVPLFHPRPLDDKKRTELGLPVGTLRYIDLRDEDVTRAIEGAPTVEVWVDEGVLASIDANPKSAVAVYFQRQLILDFVSAVVFRFAAERPEDPVVSMSFDEVKESLIGKVVELTADPNEEARDRALRECRAEPARAFALAEDKFGLRDGLGKAFRGAS